MVMVYYINYMSIKALQNCHKKIQKAVVNHPLITYVVLAYLISWSWWVPMAVGGQSADHGIGWPTHIPGLLGPTIAAVLVTLIVSGKKGINKLWQRICKWNVGWYWLSVAAVIVAGIVGILLASNTVTIVSISTYPGIEAGLNGFITLLIVFIVNGFGEEIGWRGFLVDGLLKKHSVLKVSLIVVAFWATWHFPLFFVLESFKALGLGGTIGWLFGITSGSIVLTWLYKHSGSSILLVAVWHTAFNYTSATATATGPVAAISSTLVMIAAVWIVIAELKAKK